MGTTFASLFLAAAVAAPDPAPPDQPQVLIPSARTGQADLFLIDLATGNAKNITRTESADEIYPAWGPDGTKIAFACKTRDHEFEIYVCDADGSNRKMVSTRADGPSACLAPSWSPDGRKLVYARTYPGGKCEVRVAAADGSADDVVQADAFSAAWSPDGKQIAFVRKMSGKTHGLFVMNPDGSGVRVLAEDLGPPDLYLPAWSPDAKLIAVTTASGYGSQLALVPAAGGPLRQLTHLPGNNANPVWVSADRLLFSHFPKPDAPTGAYATIKADGTRLLVHPLTKTEPAHPLARPAVVLPRREGRVADEPGPVRPAAFTVPVVEKRAPVRVVPVTGAPPVAAGAIGAVAWAADGKRLALGLEIGHVLVGEFDGKVIRPVDVVRGHEGPVEGVAFSPDGKLLYSTGGDRSVRTWDVGEKGVKTRETDHDAWVHGLAASADGKLLATGDREGVMKVRDAATGRPMQEITVCDPKRGAVNAVAFGKDDAVVFAGCGRWDVPVLHGAVAAFDPATGNQLWRTKGTFGGVFALAVSPDGSKLAGACLDTLVRVWDAGTGKELACWKGHADRVTGIAWGLGGKVVVSCGFDHTLRVWDADTGAALHTLAAHTSPVVRVATTPDGKYVLSTAQTGALFIWRLED
ncbi:MAG: repeat, subgroup [Gemmataceae bacterium]|nr:repeat, subgroup [Gemmataceae bacterium]